MHALTINASRLVTFLELQLHDQDCCNIQSCLQLYGFLVENVQCSLTSFYSRLKNPCNACLHCAIGDANIFSVDSRTPH
jgi:hypothetical protein